MSQPTPVYPRLHANLPVLLYWPVCMLAFAGLFLAFTLTHLLLPPRFHPAWIRRP